MASTEAFTWDRQKIKEVLETLAHLPDFDKMPFPDEWATEFNIPINETKCEDLKTYLTKHRQIRVSYTGTVIEQELKDNKVRENLPQAEPIDLIVHSVPCTDELPFGVSEPTKESTETEQQENQEHSSTKLTPLPDAS